MRILLYLSAMALLIIGVSLVVDPWRPVSALALPHRPPAVAPLDADVDTPARAGGLRIELVGPERLEIGARDLPMAWVAFDSDAVSDCGPPAPIPVAAMDHDLAGG